MTIRSHRWWLGLLLLALIVGLAAAALDAGSLWQRWRGTQAGPEATPPAVAERRSGSPDDRQGAAQGSNSAVAPDRLPARAEFGARTVRPYIWAGARSGQEIRLTGHVPSEEARAELVALARRLAPDGQVDDQMETANGLDSKLDFRALTGFALARLREMRHGTVELRDVTLDLRGEARDKSALAALSTAIERDLPPGARAGEVALSAAAIAPYPFTARRGPGTITLGGYFPDEKMQAEVLAFVRRRFLTEQVIDEGRLADGAPRTFLRGVLFGLEQLAQLAVGEVVISDVSLRIAGEALYEQAAERLRQTIASAPPPEWQVSSEVRTRPVGRVGADVCQERLQRRLAQAQIRFEAGAEIARESYGVLDDLAAIARNCDARIEVAGHSASGDSDRELSLHRARVVLDYMVRAGIDAGRLSAVSYGETRSPAPHDGDKARSGRVELVARALL